MTLSTIRTITILATPPPRMRSVIDRPPESNPVLVRLAKELRVAAGVPVELKTRMFEDAPIEGYVITDDLGAGFRLQDWQEDLRRDLLKRTIVLNTTRGNVFQVLEEHELAAAINFRDLSAWESSPSGGPGVVYGRVDVGELLGVVPAEEPFRSENYTYLDDRERTTLVARLAGYLSAYETWLCGKVSDPRHPTGSESLKVSDRE